MSFVARLCRSSVRPVARVGFSARPMAMPMRLAPLRQYSSHDNETFEEFTARFEKEFDEAYDLFEVQVSAYLL